MPITHIEMIGKNSATSQPVTFNTDLQHALWFKRLFSFAILLQFALDINFEDAHIVKKAGASVYRILFHKGDFIGLINVRLDHTCIHR